MRDVVGRIAPGNGNHWLSLGARNGGDSPDSDTSGRAGQVASSADGARVSVAGRVTGAEAGRTSSLTPAITSTSNTVCGVATG